MRVLTVESAIGVGAAEARHLIEEGHEVGSCWEDGQPLCRGIEGTCPLDEQPFDVALLDRHHPDDGHVPVAEAGALCALRRGIGVLVNRGPSPLGAWATERAPGEDLEVALERAIDEADARRRGPLVAEVERLLAIAGIEDHDVDVAFEHAGRTGQIIVVLTNPVDRALAGRIATRVLAVDQRSRETESTLNVVVTSRR